MATAPVWFQWAVNQPRQPHHADSGGTRIHYVSWNADDLAKPGLLQACALAPDTLRRAIVLDSTRIASWARRAEAA